MLCCLDDFQYARNGGEHCVVLSVTGCGVRQEILGVRRPRVAVVTPLVVPDVVVKLMDTLADGGVDVTEVPQGTLINSDPDAIAVILSPATVDTTMIDASVGDLKGRMVPVAIDGSASPLFPDVSQVILSATTIEDSARRIATIARGRGGDVGRYFALARIAAAWQAAGEPVADLLTGSEVQHGIALLASGAPDSVPGSEPGVRALVAASVERQRRRRRVATIGVSVAVVVLLSATLGALLSQGRASAAAEAAQVQTAEADSQRLSAEAIGQIGNDPDLPLLLASEGLRAAPTDAATEAARRALVMNLPHTSLALPGTPIWISSAVNAPRIAIQYSDGQVELRDSDNGELSFALDTAVLPDVDQGVLLSADGTRIAAVHSGRLQIVELPSGAVRDGQVDGSPVLWLDARNLLINGINDSAPSVLNVDTGAVRLLSGVTTPILLSALSPRGGVLAVQAQNTVSVLSAESLAPMAQIDAPGATDLSFNGDGAIIAVANGGQSPILFFNSDGTEAYETEYEGGGLVRAQTVSPGPGNSLIAMKTPYNVSVLGFSEEAMFIEQVVNLHRGPTAGLARTTSGTLTSIGADRYLRFWSMPTTTSYGPIPGTFWGDSLEKRYGSFGSKGLRLQLGLDEVNVTALPMTIYGGRTNVAVLNASTLQAVATGLSVPDILPQVLSSNGHFTAAVDANAKTIAVINVATGKQAWYLKDVITCNGSPTPTAVSPSGEYVACQSVDGVNLVRRNAPDPQIVLPDDRTYVAIFVDDSGNVSAVTGDGRLLRSGSPEGRASPQGAPVVTAAADPSLETVFSVTSSGQLFRARGGSSILLADVGGQIAPIAIHYSPAARMVMLIGANSTAVIDSETGQVLLNYAPTSPSSAARDSVGVDGAVIIGQRHGRVVRVPILRDTELTEAMAKSAPRQLTDAERALYIVPRER